ncbi:MAG TPA: redoxin domain-containing protein [Flavihumibacter sp.]
MNQLRIKQRSAGIRISKILVAALLTASLLTVAGNAVRAQENKAAAPAPYERFKTLPPFELLGLDGKTFKRDDLPRNRGTILMFFSPDCHHCLTQMDWMKEAKEQLKGFNFVLATYQPMEALKTFHSTYRLEEWKNIYVGRDEKYFLPPYFRIKNLPFLALYDKKGKLISVFEGNTKTELILTAFK